MINNIILMRLTRILSLLAILFTLTACSQNFFLANLFDSPSLETCKGFADNKDVWMYDSSLSTDQKCVLVSRPEFTEKWGEWQVEADYLGDLNGEANWSKMRYTKCGIGYELIGTECKEEGYLLKKAEEARQSELIAGGTYITDTTKTDIEKLEDLRLEKEAELQRLEQDRLAKEEALAKEQDAINRLREEKLQETRAQGDAVVSTSVSINESLAEEKRIWEELTRIKALEVEKAQELSLKEAEMQKALDERLAREEAIRRAEEEKRNIQIQEQELMDKEYLANNPCVNEETFANGKCVNLSARMDCVWPEKATKMIPVNYYEGISLASNIPDVVRLNEVLYLKGRALDKSIGQVMIYGKYNGDTEQTRYADTSDYGDFFFDFSVNEKGTLDLSIDGDFTVPYAITVIEPICEKKFSVDGFSTRNLRYKIEGDDVVINWDTDEKLSRVTIKQRDRFVQKIFTNGKSRWVVDKSLFEDFARGYALITVDSAKSTDGTSLNQSSNWGIYDSEFIYLVEENAELIETNYLPILPTVSSYNGNSYASNEAYIIAGINNMLGNTLEQDFDLTGVADNWTNKMAGGDFLAFTAPDNSASLEQELDKLNTGKEYKYFVYGEGTGEEFIQDLKDSGQLMGSAWTKIGVGVYEKEDGNLVITLILGE